MIIFILFVNAVAMICCGIAAGTNFSNDNAVMGVSMVALFIMNLALFATNLGRI